jgi:uncharacterized protein (TIGR02145 family)
MATFNIEGYNTLASGTYQFDIQALNKICADQGGTGGHLFVIAALNEIAGTVGQATDASFNITALNRICIGCGGVGGHSFEIDAINELITLWPPIVSVVISDQRWAVSNFDKTQTITGIQIPQVTDNSAWAALTTPAWCYYNNDPANTKLYNHAAVKLIFDDINTYNATHGVKYRWQVATKSHYLVLGDNLGGATVAGGKMKEVGTTHWNSPNTGATNESGFTGLGSGLRADTGGFSSIKAYGVLWSSTEFNATDSLSYYMLNTNDDLAQLQAGKKYGYSIRLVSGFAIGGNTLISGDSTIAAYLAQYAVERWVPIGGGTILDFSTPGETILQQHARYTALSAGVKSALKNVIIQIGLNDVEAAETNAAKVARYQAYIDEVATDSPDAIITLGTMTPARGLFSAPNYLKWVALNESIRGEGANPITGADYVATEHTDLLSDGNGYLHADYDMGDHIHENNAGRKIVAQSWMNAIF